mgnify:FL=1
MIEESTPETAPKEFAAVRKVALELLCATEQGNRFIDELLAERIGGFDPRDRRLLQEISYGALRHQNTLDRLLKAYLKLSMDRQAPVVRWALRLGAYQLVYLSRVPAHAAVNQTLEGMKSLEGGGKKEVGFVNAVLHRLARDITRKTSKPPAERDDPNVLPSRDGFCHFNRPVLPLVRLDLVDHLGVKYSYPRWLVESWIARFGAGETAELLVAGNRSPKMYARVTSRAPSLADAVAELESEGFKVEAGPHEGSVLFAGGGPGPSQALEKGWIQFQDLTSMQIGAALAPPANARVLDLCSAPGGKAAQLLDGLGEEGVLLATDRSEARLALVEENLSRNEGNWKTKAVPEDPARIELGESFTHVLVDAPCSNTGVLGRRPEARWRVRRKDLESLAALQDGLLDAAVRHLQPGGRLVYSTCSIEPQENEERVAALLRRSPGLVELETRLFLPHRGDGDGGYYSLLCNPVKKES